MNSMDENYNVLTLHHISVYRILFFLGVVFTFLFILMVEISLKRFESVTKKAINELIVMQIECEAPADCKEMLLLFTFAIENSQTKILNFIFGILICIAVFFNSLLFAILQIRNRFSIYNIFAVIFILMPILMRIYYFYL